MKFIAHRNRTPCVCRTPQGVRGLKSVDEIGRLWGLGSHPARGAWIEIFVQCPQLRVFVSHPARGAWIEIPVSQV